MLQKITVSEHLIRFYTAAKIYEDEWQTAYFLAEKANITKRLANEYCMKLVRHGVFDVIISSPNKYQLSKRAMMRNRPLIEKLEAARANNLTA